MLETIQETPTIDIESLARLHSPRLRNFIRKHIHDLEAVEDVFQQTYLAALESSNRYQGNAQPQTWLFGIAFNLVREHNRKRFRTAQYLPIEDYQTSLEDPKACLETNLHNKRYINALMNSYEQLPSHMQQVLKLSSVDNKDYGECAETLKVPVGTIRSRLSRARSLLRSQAERYHRKPSTN